jgi:hypothetical protein
MQMNDEIENYNSLQSVTDQKICNIIMDEINRKLPKSVSKIWHGSPVWFIDDNPIVGYSRLKNYIQLLFWSGQTFEEDGLKPVGKYKAAEARYTEANQIDMDQLAVWLSKSIDLQWDYKNIRNSNGVLLRL